MLYRTKSPVGKTLYRSKPLLLSAQEGYARPPQGKAWFMTTTTVWRVDEVVRRSVRDWRRLTNETGHSGTRTGAMRKDHDSVYTGTVSVFPAPLVEWMLSDTLQAGVIYWTLLQEAHPAQLSHPLWGTNTPALKSGQIKLLRTKPSSKTLSLEMFNTFVVMEGFSEADLPKADCALTCPPYYDLEEYDGGDSDLSGLSTYAEFNASMAMCAEAHRGHMKPGAFVCIVVGPFCDKKTGELIDFPAHTVENFREAGFSYHQQIVLSKNFASAAVRSTNAWKGHKLVPAHEFLLVFKTPT